MNNLGGHPGGGHAISGDRRARECVVYNNCAHTHGIYVYEPPPWSLVHHDAMVEAGTRVVMCV